MSLVLRAADGDSQLVPEPSFAGAMGAHGALSFRGAHRIHGCYVLEGDADEVGELISDSTMEYLAERKYGEKTRPDIMELLGVRILVGLHPKSDFAYSPSEPLEHEEFAMPVNSVTETELTTDKVMVVGDYLGKGETA